MTTSETLCKRIAVIPARSGSKRLKDKNLKLLHNKPLLVWTVEAAIEANCFDRIIVSTDGEAIAEVARRAGAEVPFMRPDSLATDSASPVDVGLNLLASLEPENYQSLTWLQPTSPLRNAADIIASHAIYDDKQADCVISVCDCEHSPLWTGPLAVDGNMQEFLDNPALQKRSQDLPGYYRLNGAIYIVNTALFRRYRSFYIKRGRSFAYSMPAQRSIDIDTQWDFELAEFALARSQ